jgi:cellulose synthase operon protein C
VEQLTRASQEFIGQGGRISETLVELGRTYELQGDRARADDAYRRGLDTDPTNADGYFFYARFLSADRRNREKARLTAQKYLELDPRGEHSAEAQSLTHSSAR